MMWYVYVTIYHLIIMLLGFKQVSNAWNMTAKSSFFEHGRGNLWKFLSVWVQVLTHSYFFTYAIIYIEKRLQKKKSPKEFNIKVLLNNIYFSLIFPLTMLICFGFWGLFLYDRKIIYPEEMDEYFPFYYCHIYHTVPAIVVFIELLRGYLKTPTYRSTIWPLGLVTTIYISILFKTYAEEKKWMYLVFYEVSVSQAIAAHVFFFSVVPMLLLKVGISLNICVVRIRKLLESKEEETTLSKLMEKINFDIYKVFK